MNCLQYKFNDNFNQNHNKHYFLVRNTSKKKESEKKIQKIILAMQGFPQLTGQLIYGCYGRGYGTGTEKSSSGNEAITKCG